MTKGDPPAISEARCTCEIGMLGACGHISGMLYTISKFKVMGYKLIPEDVAKTSQPQSWHIPRGPQITGKPVQEVEVHGYSSTTTCTPSAANKDTQRAIKSTLYNPIRLELPSVEGLHRDIKNAFPSSLVLDTLSLAQKQLPVVSTKYGPYVKGSPLSYQQALTSDCFMNMYGDIDFPSLPVKNVMINNVCVVISKELQEKMESLSLTQSEIEYFEKNTRLQSTTKLWYKIRENRITASSVGQIYKRKKADVSKLLDRLTSTHHVQTAAMKRGLQMEPQAAKEYSTRHQDSVNINPCGVVVSLHSPWLAASPDRKVYMPSRDPPFGLLEIKCTESDVVTGVDYLKQDNQGVVALNKNHNHYFQVLTQLAVTGLDWCDFFVWCPASSTCHYETIWFDSDKWQDVKDKVDLFFLDHFLPHFKIWYPNCNHSGINSSSMFKWSFLYTNQ